MKQFIFRNLWWVTFVLSLVLLGVHSFKITKFSVDSTSIMLLAIMLISPFIAAVRKIKFGDFEAEIDPKEVQKIKANAEKNIEPKTIEEESQPEIYSATDAIRKLADSDPVIALAKIRIELEKVLSRLAGLSSMEMKGISLGALVNKLSNEEVISSHVGKSLREVTSICNRAIHGESIADKDAYTIIEIGCELLEGLFWDMRDQSTSGTVVAEEIIRKEVYEEHFYKTKYRLTSIVPLVENPKKIVRELNQTQLDDYLEGYHEYAEFIIELVEIQKQG
jgi:hypothetical protein